MSSRFIGCFSFKEVYDGLVMRPFLGCKFLVKKHLKGFESLGRRFLTWQTKSAEWSGYDVWGNGQLHGAFPLRSISP
jgi:hypothetical protein